MLHASRSRSAPSQCSWSVAKQRHGACTMLCAWGTVACKRAAKMLPMHHNVSCNHDTHDCTRPWRTPGPDAQAGLYRTCSCIMSHDSCASARTCVCMCACACMHARACTGIHTPSPESCAASNPFAP